MTDDPSAVTPAKPRASAALIAFSALAGLALLFILIETAVRAITNIAGNTVEIWAYWPYAIAVKELLFDLFPLVCFVLFFITTRPRGLVFLLLAIAWQSALLAYCIWEAEPAYFLRFSLPLLLSIACMLVVFLRAKEPGLPPPLTVIGVFAGALVAYISLESTFNYAFSPYWGPEGIIPSALNIFSLALLAPFYIRRKGVVKRFHLVFLSLAAAYQLFFCGMEAYSAIRYAITGQLAPLEALSTAVPDLGIIACMAVALILAVKGYRAHKGAPIDSVETQDS